MNFSLKAFLTSGLIIMLNSIPFCGNAQQTDDAKLWFNTPASASAKDTSAGWINDAEWLKALPVGNGFLGAMVFGDVNIERIQLNEKSLWSGGTDDSDNPEAAKYLQEIRNLLFAGKYKEATALTNKTQVCKGVGSGQGNGAEVPFGCFQTLGDLWIDFKRNASYTNYYRELNLINGIALTKYEQDGIVYTREIFASYPDRALIIRLTANKPNSLSFSIGLNRPEKFITDVQDKSLKMIGTLSNGKGGNGMKYKVIAKPILTGGTLTTDGDRLSVSKATAVSIIITALIILFSTLFILIRITR